MISSAAKIASATTAVILACSPNSYRRVLAQRRKPEPVCPEYPTAPSTVTLCFQPRPAATLHAGREHTTLNGPEQAHSNRAPGLTAEATAAGQLEIVNQLRFDKHQERLKHRSELEQRD